MKVPANNSPSTDVWFGVVGRLKLCQPHVDMVAKGLKVCKPVISTPKAKFPFPTWTGVVSELALRRTLRPSTIFRLCIGVSAWARGARGGSSDEKRSRLFILHNDGPLRSLEVERTKGV